MNKTVIMIKTLMMILIWKLHGNQVFKVKAEEKSLNSNKTKKEKI